MLRCHQLQRQRRKIYNHSAPRDPQWPRSNEYTNDSGPINCQSLQENYCRGLLLFGGVIRIISCRQGRGRCPGFSNSSDNRSSSCNYYYCCTFTLCTLSFCCCNLLLFLQTPLRCCGQFLSRHRGLARRPQGGLHPFQRSSFSA